MGRLWQSLIPAKWNPLFANLPVESLVYANQAGYYRAIAASTEATDCAPFVEFMLDVIYQTLLSPASGGNLGKGLGINWGKELSKNQKAIVRLLLDNPRMTLKEMAEHLAVSTTTI